MSPERFVEKAIPQSEQPPAEQNPEVSFDSLGDPEASVIAAEEFLPIVDAEASPGPSWDREGGPSPSTAQSDYVAPQDEVGDVTVADTLKPRREAIASSHSRASSYDRLYANEKLASPPKQAALPHDPYKPTGSSVQYLPPTNQFVPARHRDLLLCMIRTNRRCPQIRAQFPSRCLPLLQSMAMARAQVLCEVV
jgi:hypothetical protein